MYLKYFESGFVPVPIRPGTKMPAVSGFNKWATEGIGRANVEEFEEKFPLSRGYGIGIVLGSSSGLCCVDIDTDDDKIMRACPPSPVRRRGKKGEARFFKWNETLQNRAFLGEGIGGVDILVDRKYIIVPPSIHPETKKNYFWTSVDDLLSIDRDDLPELTLDDVDKIGELYGASENNSISGVDLEGNYTSPDSKRAPHGSHNRLKTLACGLVSECESLESAVKKLLTYDECHHTPIGYFDDRRSGSDFGADRYSNAARFYSCLLKSVNENRIKKGLSIQVPVLTEIDVSEIKPADKPVSQFIAYPKPRGLMLEFATYCELNSNGRQDALGLGGSLILMAGLCSNRYCSSIRGMVVSPNLYVLNLGYSSFGKDLPQRLLDDLLVDTGMIGSANYRSGSSMVQFLPEQQERVDLIDECTWLLNAMGSDKEYQAEMVEILSLLFSRASSRFNGIASVAKGNRYGAVYNPHVSLLASTTPTGFKESVTSAMASKGLMPRFLTFFQKEIGEYKGDRDLVKSKVVLARLKQGVAFILKQEKRCLLKPPVNYMAKRNLEGFRDGDMGLQYNPVLIKFEPRVEKRWAEYAGENHRRSAKDPNHFDSPFYGRFAEQAAKLCLLDAVSLSRDVILMDSLEWAIEVVETQWVNIKPMYEFATAVNKLEKNQLQIVEIISQNSGMIRHTALYDKTRGLTRKERQEHIETLKEMGKIVVMPYKDPKNPKQKKPVTFYFTPEAYYKTVKETPELLQ